MVCCIGLGKIDKNLLPMLFASVFCFLNRLLNQYKEVNLTQQKSIILMNIVISSSKLFGIIPYLITLKFYNNDIKNEKISKINNVSRETHVNEIKRIKQVKWRYLFFSAFVFFLNQMTYVITIPIKTNTSNLNILITSLFYYLVFKNKLYIHHYLSCALIIIIGFTIDMTLNNIKNDFTENMWLFFVRIIREVLYSLSSIIDKYIMEKKFISVYLLLLSNGVIILVALLIFAVFDYFFFDIDDYNKFFSEFNYKELLVILGVIITQFTLNLGILLTNKYYSPCHIFIIFVCGQLALYVIHFDGKSAGILVGLFSILFLSLIFNEIIEINVCGLSKNTKRNISKRAEDEDSDLYITKSDTLESVFEGQYEVKLKDKDLWFEQNNENSEK